MTLKERIEENVAVWLLGSLLTGFLSGIAAYKGVQEMAGLEPVAKSERQEWQQKAHDAESHASQLQAELDKTTEELKAAKARSTDHDTKKSKLPSGPAPTASTKREIQQSNFPELQGVKIEIVFTDDAATKAIEVKDRLEKLGMKVKLNRFDDSGYPSAMVYYYKPHLVGPAARVLDVLRDYGFQAVSSQNPERTLELLIKLP